jgi:hypothetical protein
VSSGVLCRVALVRTDASEEHSASFIRATRISGLGTTLVVTCNRRLLVFVWSVRRLLVTASVVPSSPILVTLMKEELRSSETSVFTRATWCNIPEDAILHSHYRENLKSYNFPPASPFHCINVSVCKRMLLNSFAQTDTFRFVCLRIETYVIKVNQIKSMQHRLVSCSCRSASSYDASKSRQMF